MFGFVRPAACRSSAPRSVTDGCPYPPLPCRAKNRNKIQLSSHRKQEISGNGGNSFHRLRLLLPPLRRGTRSARPRGLGGDFEFLPLKSPRNPITPIKTSRVATLHPGLYKRLREGAQPPKTSLLEGGGPPRGRWKELRKAFSKLHMLHIHHMPDTHQAYDVFSLFLSYFVLFPQTKPSKKPAPAQPFSVK